MLWSNTVEYESSRPRSEHFIWKLWFPEKDCSHENRNCETARSTVRFAKETGHEEFRVPTIGLICEIHNCFANAQKILELMQVLENLQMLRFYRRLFLLCIIY